MIRRRFAIALVFVALFAAGWWTGRSRASGSRYASADLFLEVLHEVNLNYVDPVVPAHLIDGALHGMLRDLDPHARWLPRAAYEAWRRGSGPDAAGVGVTVDVRSGWPVVIAPLEGSPAWDGGLREGDIVTRIGERSAGGLALDEVERLLAGAAGTTLELRFVRRGEPEPRTVTLTRRAIAPGPVTDAFIAGPGLAAVRLAAITPLTHDALRGTLDSLRRAGARGLVLDLRGTAGGSLADARAVAGLFVPSGTRLSVTRGRDTTQAVPHLSAEPRPLLDWPMAVLVDHGSAQAAELLAGSLQDLDRAVVVGATTYGFAADQQLFPLRGDTGAVLLTVAVEETPSGRRIEPPAAASLAADDGAEDDEGTDDATAPAADTVPRPRFRSRAGRLIVGGGGITPDLAVAGDSLAVRPRRNDERRAALLADPVFLAAAARVRAAREVRGVFAVLPEPH